VHKMQYNRIARRTKVRQKIDKRQMKWRHYRAFMSSIAMADVTRQPWQCEMCVNSTTITKSNAINVALQLGTLWHYKSRQQCNSKRCGAGALQLAVLQHYGVVDHHDVEACGAMTLCHCDSRCCDATTLRCYNSRCYDTTVS
jgi:hypothetical protein